MQVIRGTALSFIPASHEDPKHPGVLKKVLCSKDMLPAGRLQMINWACLGAGKSFQRHYHEDMLEVFVIISGTVEMEVSGEREILNAQDAVIIPELARHVMHNRGTEDAHYIALGISSERGGKTIVVGD